MENQYEELIRSFEAKLRQLILEYKALKEQNKMLESELERKHTDLMEAHKEVLELRKSYDHLQIANGLGDSEEEKTKSKQQIMKMVREIDKCIALLDE